MKPALLIAVAALSLTMATLPIGITAALLHPQPGLIQGTSDTSIGPSQTGLEGGGIYRP